MKILIVNFSDVHGGAARAAVRLHEALVDNDIDSKLLVNYKESNGRNVLGGKSLLSKIKFKLKYRLDSSALHEYPNRSMSPFSPGEVGNQRILKEINRLKPDIVHLHWIGGGMMRIEDLAKINVPIVWSLHDDWAYTGGCHLKFDCENYINECGKCPALKSVDINDLSHRVYERKSQTFGLIEKMTIVGLSRWKAQCAMNSSLLKDHSVVNLPNPIDTNVFKNFGQVKARRDLELPSDKKLILFGAMNAGSDKNKGFNELKMALDRLENEDVHLVIFGMDKPIEGQGFKRETHYMGTITSDSTLVKLYSAVDLTVVPSRQENLSNVIMESLACSTPVVAFDVGGNSDLVEHKINGFLAKKRDSEDLLKGINWILNNGSIENVRDSGRTKVLSEFEKDIVAKKYIQLYRSLLS